MLWSPLSRLGHALYGISFLGVFTRSPRIDLIRALNDIQVSKFEVRASLVESVAGNHE